MAIQTIPRSVARVQRIISAVHMILIRTKKMQQVWRRPTIQNSLRLIRVCTRLSGATVTIALPNDLVCTAGILLTPSVLRKASGLPFRRWAGGMVDDTFLCRTTLHL